MSIPIRSFRLLTKRSQAVRSSLLIAFLSVLILIVSVSLQLTRAQQPAASQTFKSSSAKTDEKIPLELGRRLDRRLAGEQAHSFLLSVAAGQFVRVTAEQRGMDLVLALYDWNGKKLVETNRLNGSYGPEELLWVAETEAELRIEARALDEKAPEGNYQIRLAEQRAAEPMDQKRLAAQQAVSEGLQLIEQFKREAHHEAVKQFEEAERLWREAGSTHNVAFTQMFLGMTWAGLDEKEKAGEVWRKALAFWEKAGNRHEQAIVLIGLGNAAGNDLRKALEHYERAVATAVISGDERLARAIADGTERLCNEQEGQSLFYCAQKLLSFQRQIKDQKGVAESLIVLGNLSPDRRRALGYWKQALSLSRSVGARRVEAIALGNIGSIWLGLGNKRKALGHYEQSLPPLRAIGDQIMEVAVLIVIGNLWSELRDRQKALEYYEQSLPLLRAMRGKNSQGVVQESDLIGAGLSLRKVGDKEAAVLEKVGDLWSELGEKRKAVEYYEQTLPQLRAMGDQDAEATLLYKIGNLWSELEEKHKALGYHEQALPLYREMKDKPLEAVMLITIGCAWYELGDWRKALEYLEQALPLTRALDGHPLEVTTLSVIGLILSELGENGKALGYLEQALALYREMKDQDGEALILNKIGVFWFKLGEKRKALEYLKKALPLCRARKAPALKAEILRNIAFVSILLGGASKINAYYKPALTLLRVARDQPLEAVTGPGGIDAMQKLQAKSFKRLDALICSDMGWLAFHSKEYRKALDYYEQSLRLCRKAGDRNMEAEALGAIGEVWATLREKRKALEYYAQSLLLSRSLGIVRLEAMTLSRQMDLLGVDNPRLAILFGKQSVNYFQQLRSNVQTLDKSIQQTFLNSIEDTYRKLAELLIAQGRIAEAELVQEMLKDEEYFRYLRRDPKVASALSRRVDLTNDEVKALAEYARLGDQITAIGTELTKLEDLKLKLPEGAAFPQQARLNELKMQIKSANRAFEVFMRQLKEEFGKQDKRLEKIEPRLQSHLSTLGLKSGLRGTVIITTIAGEERLHLIVTTPSAQEAHTFEIKKAELNKLVAEFREAVAHPCACFDPREAEAGKKLYKLLVEPLGKDLKGAEARTLLWSLDGTLRYLPIAALWDGERKQYLGEQYDNVVITTASLENMHVAPQPVSQWRALGLGVSKQWGNLQALPNVPDELKGIIRQDDESSTEGSRETGVLPGLRLLDEDFTLERFDHALGRYSVIHAATHFSFLPGKERSSYLLLGDGNPYTLDAVSVSTPIFSGVELLALSACNTAMGSGSDGAEVESFGRLAESKGAMAVLATLWAVADESTAKLMREFYRIRVTKPKLTKTEALRQAQLALLRGEVKAGDASVRRESKLVGQAKDGRFPEYKPDSEKPYAHPYYWAPFTLIGNWR